MPNLLNTVYQIGGASKPLPVGVTITIDPGTKRTLVYTGLAAGVGIGLALGAVWGLVQMAKKRKS